MTQPKATVEYRAIKELKELPGNPRTISKKQFETLKKSLQDNQDYFEARPIILSNRTGENIILAGNQRYKAAKALGMTEVPTILLEGLTEERENEIVIRDNVENGDWDMDALANEWDAGQLQDWGVSLPGFDDSNEEYDKFVDKFKPKLTTDDCYTPPEVFKTVEEYVRKKFNLGNIENIRPFKPGGDYKREEYEGKVVIDNPPFSILSEIVRWFSQEGVKFFLFAPYLSTLPIASECQTTKVIVGVSITYENGAKVPTNFVTNMGDPEILVIIDGKLRKRIEEAQPSEAAELEKYNRPKNLKVATDLAYCAKNGNYWELTAKDCHFIKNAEELKKLGKGLYGGGLLVSDRAAERAAAERAAVSFELSPSEQLIVKKLNGEA